MTIAPCGMACEDCKDYGNVCGGCNAIQGKVYWASYLGVDACPKYDCCKNQKRLDNCGRCEQLPCRLFMDIQDPSMSDEEHLGYIELCVKTLKELQENV